VLVLGGRDELQGRRAGQAGSHIPAAVKSLVVMNPDRLALGRWPLACLQMQLRGLPLAVHCSCKHASQRRAGRLVLASGALVCLSAVSAAPFACSGAVRRRARCGPACKLSEPVSALAGSTRREWAAALPVSQAHATRGQPAQARGLWRARAAGD